MIGRAINRTAKTGAMSALLITSPIWVPVALFIFAAYLLADNLWFRYEEPTSGN